MSFNKVKLFVEWEGEELFFNELKKRSILWKNITIKSFWWWNKALKQDWILNTKYLNKKINLAVLSWFSKVIFLFDLEKCDLTKVNSEIASFSNPCSEIDVNFFLEVSKFESWLLSDKEAIIKSICIPKKKQNSFSIWIPTDNIMAPEKSLKNIYNKYKCRFKKNNSELDIASNFCLNRWAANSISLCKFNNYLKTI